MKKIHYTIQTLFLVAVVLFSSCSSDDDFILRSTDRLAFEYSHSTQTFTLCSSGAWSLETSDPWLTIDKMSGVGDGHTREVITVTAQRNSNKERKGSIVMHTVQGELVIDITQDDGFITLKDASLFGSLIKEDALEQTSLVIPYSKGTQGEKVNFETVVTGKAAAGIEVKTIELTIEQEEGEFIIPVSGTPTELGEVTFTITSSLKEVEPFVVNAKVTDGIFYEQKFDLMVWGGDCVANKKGIKGGFKSGVGGKVIDESVPVTECTAGSDGSNDLIATMAPSYRELRGFSGWSGKRIYERPGFVKISTGSSTDGHIISPSFKEMGVLATEVQVSFKASQYYEDNGGVLQISVIKGGEASIREFALKPGSERVWETVQFTISNATEDTQIQIASAPEKGRRFSFDEFVISKAKHN